MGEGKALRIQFRTIHGILIMLLVFAFLSAFLTGFDALSFDSGAESPASFSQRMQGMASFGALRTFSMSELAIERTNKRQDDLNRSFLLFFVQLLFGILLLFKSYLVVLLLQKTHLCIHRAVLYFHDKDGQKSRISLSII